MRDYDDEYDDYNEQPEGKGKTVRNTVVFLIALLAAAAVVAFLYLNGMLNLVGRTEKRPEDVVAASSEDFEKDADGPDTLEADDVSFDINSINLLKDDEIKNLLLIGQDARPGEERQRSDTMIICSINTRDNKITLTSLMRDMYVPIPGYSDNRINSAYAFGGMELLDAVIEQDFGVHIDGNIEVNFEGFIAAMSAVGNLDIELTADEAYYMNNHDWTEQGENTTGWMLVEGMNSLTPEQALAYSRIRDIGNSDYERTERQRKVVLTAFKKASEGGLMSMMRLAKDVAPYLTTDMNNADLLSYIGTIGTLKISNTESYRLPVDGTYSGEMINGMSVLVPDLYANSEYLQQYIYGENDTTTE